MWRNILAVLAGAIAGSIVVGVLEMIGHLIIPPPPGMDPTNMESVKQTMSQLKPAAFMAILVAWAAGAFAAGWTAASISVRGKTICALIAAGVIQFSGLATLIMIPHPLWFCIVSMLLPMPAAWLAARLALGQPKTTASTV